MKTTIVVTLRWHDRLYVVREKVNIPKDNRPEKAERIIVGERMRWWVAARPSDLAAMIDAWLPDCEDPPPLDLSDNEEGLVLESIEHQGTLLWPCRKKPHHLPHDDKPLENPFDTSPKNENEAIHDLKVQALCQSMGCALANTRKWITMQQLCEMKNLHPVFEGELPEVDGVRHGVFLFSVAGDLEGKKLERVLMGGHCMQVSASGQAEAARIAQEALNDTIKYAKDFAFAEHLGLDLNDNAGVTIESELRPTKH